MARFLLLIVVGGRLAAWSAEPPPPNPQDPVDYVAWVNAEFMRDLVDNAADAYQAAGSLFVRADVALPTDKPACAWSPEERQKVEDYVKRNAAMLDQLTAAAAKKRCYFPLESESGPLLNALLRTMPDMRALTRVLALHGQLRLATGDAKGAVDNAVALLAIAQHLESQPTLVAHHTGGAARALAYSLLLGIPGSPARVDFAGIAERVEQADPRPSKPKLQLALEKVIAWDTAQRLLKDRAGDGQYTAEGAIARREGPMGDGRIETNQAIVFGPRTWAQVMRDIDEYFAELDKVAEMNCPQALEAAAKLADYIKDQPESFMKLSAAPRAATGALRGYACAIASRRGTLLVLYLHAYRARNGRWPDDLKAMLPESEQTLAIDPFSGQPFVYRFEKGEPRLYSVSENGADDGGGVFPPPAMPRWGKTGDFVFWPRPRCP